MNEKEKKKKWDSITIFIVIIIIILLDFFLFYLSRFNSPLRWVALAETEFNEPKM